jgi:hypothetical protein
MSGMGVSRNQHNGRNHYHKRQKRFTKIGQMGIRTAENLGQLCR